MRKLLPALTLLTLACWGVWRLSRTAADHPAFGDGRLHPIAEGTFVYRGFSANSGVAVLRDSVLVVDAQPSPAAARSLRETLWRTTPKPVAHVMLTSPSASHAGGASTFEGVEIVTLQGAPPVLEEQLSKRPTTWRLLGLAVRELPRVPAPTRTIPGGTRLELDGEHIELLDVSTPASPGLALVWLPERRVAFSGDALSTWGVPWVGDPASLGAIDVEGGWKLAIEQLRRLRPQILVPAHGPVLEGEDAISARLALHESVLSAGAAAAKAKAEEPLDAAVEAVVRAMSPALDRAKVDETVLSRRHLALALIASTKFVSWRELGPQAPARPPRGEALAILDGTLPETALSRARELVDDGQRGLAVAVLEEQLTRTPDLPELHALLADVLYAEALDAPSLADASASTSRALEAARKALELQPRHPLAASVMGCLQVWGAAFTGQSRTPAIADLEAALATGTLKGDRRRRALWCLARAHALDGRSEEADRWLRAWVPGPARFAFPLLAPRLRALP